MILFPDQEIALDQARQKLRELPARLKTKGIERKPRLLIQAPCGFGKTAISAFISKNVADRGGSSWFICHRDFLCDQTSLTFKDVGIDHSFLAAGRRLNLWTDTQIGMISSLKTRGHKVAAPTVAIWDEAHHLGAKTWAERMNAMPDTIHIGLSATPMRTDKQGLDAFFDDMVMGPSVADLIAKKRLSDFTYYTPSKPDLSGVHVRMGEYVAAEIDEEMNKAKIVGNIVDSYRKYANGTRAVYFATSVLTSRRYAQAFRDSQINAVHLDADTPSHERKAAAMAMAMGKIQVICNVGLFGEGYDLSAQAGRPVTIETVGLCRPTKSLPLLIQMMMRCMRAKSYPGIILDHAGCFNEHNFLPDDPIEWTLQGAKRDTTTGTFQCQGCGATLKRGSSLCAHCGSDNKRKVETGAAPRIVEHVDGELEQVDRDARVRQQKIEQGQAKTLEELIKLAKARGYKNPVGWSAHVYSARLQGRKEPR